MLCLLCSPAAAAVACVRLCGIPPTPPLHLIISPLSPAVSGLGATLTKAQLVDTITTKKRAVGIGFLSQFLLLPLATFLLALALGVSDTLGTAMVIVASSPGGSTSNLFTYYARLDVALSITMTACSTLLALGLMPLNTFVYARQFTDENIDIDYVSMVLSLLLVLVPVSVGVYIKHKSDKWAARTERVSSAVGVLFIAVALVFGIASNTHIFDGDWRLWVASVAMLMYGALFGYGASKAARLSEVEARTVSLETGIQNSTLSLAVISLSFPSDTEEEKDLRDDLLVMPLLYSVFLILDAIVLTLLFRWKPVPADPDRDEDGQDATPKATVELTGGDVVAVSASPLGGGGDAGVGAGAGAGVGGAAAAADADVDVDVDVDVNAVSPHVADSGAGTADAADVSGGVVAAV